MYLIFLFALVFKLVMIIGCGVFSWKISSMIVTPTLTWRIIAVGWLFMFIRASVNLYYLVDISGFASNYEISTVIMSQLLEALAMTMFLVAKVRIWTALINKFEGYDLTNYKK